MASNVDKFLDASEHAALDHTGLPGVGVGGGGGITGEVVPAGVIMPFGGTVASIPVGYLACDGTVVAQASYPALFTAIGTTWDTGGEGGGNFRLPDLRGKSPVGLNDGTLPAGVDGGFTTRNLAGLGGAETDNHSHSGPSHSHTGGTDSAGSHNHGGTTGDAYTIFGFDDPFQPGGVTHHQHLIPTDGSHTHPISATSVESGTTGAAAGDNMSPFAVVAYIIKAEEAAPTVSGIGSDTLPVGTMTPFAGTIGSVPVGFLPCDGSLADETVEAELFTIIGSAWNIGGEPGGFFRLPDMRGKSIVGLNDPSLPAGTDGGFTTRLLADAGGGEDTGHSHGFGSYAAGSSGSDHQHSGTTNTNSPTASQGFPGIGGTFLPPDHTHSFTTGSDGSHTHPVSGTSGSDNSTNMSPFAVCAYIIKSRQVGGGIGVTAQNNGGVLQGMQPTLNFIPSGGAGVTVLEDVGNNRIDITISAPAAGGLTSAQVMRGRTSTGTTASASTMELTSGGTGGTGLVFAIAVLIWDDAGQSISIGVHDGPTGGTAHTLAFELSGSQNFRTTTNAMGATQDAVSQVELDDNGGAGSVPRIERFQGAGLFSGIGWGLRIT